MAIETGAGLAVQVGTATDAIEAAVDGMRDLLTLTGTERKRVNETMDDLTIAAERLKIAHQRMLERANAPMGGRL